MSSETKEIEAAVQETERRKKIKADVKRWRAELQDSARLAVEAIAKVTPIGEAAPSLEEQSKILGEAVHAVREVVRPEPKTAAFYEENSWYHIHDPVYHTPKAARDFVLGNPPFGTVEPSAKPLSPDAPELVPGSLTDPGKVVCPHRKMALDVFDIGGLDFVRHEGDGERIIYTSIAAPHHHPQPILVRMTLVRHVGYGWLAFAFNTFGEQVMRLEIPCGGRFNAENMAKRALSAYVSRRLHKSNQRNAYLRRVKARKASCCRPLAVPPAAPHPAPLSPEEELADTIARQKGEEVEA